jgi:hypothetical protein
VTIGGRCKAAIPLAMIRTVRQRAALTKDLPEGATLGADKRRCGAARISVASIAVVADSTWTSASSSSLILWPASGRTSAQWPLADPSPLADP